IAWHTRVIVIRLALHVTSRTGKERVGTRRGMAFRTLVPHARVRPGVDGEILVVVVKRGRRPGTLVVTRGAVRGELCLHVIRVGRHVIVLLVTSRAGVWRIGVVAVVTRYAVVGDQRVRPI